MTLPSAIFRTYLFIVVAIALLTTHALCGSLKGNKKVASGKSATSKEESMPTSFNVSVVTWNLAEKKVTEADSNFLKLQKDNDFIVLGVQECENIKPRREEGHRSKAWRIIQRNALGKSFECVAEHKMGGLQIAVFAKKNVAKHVQGLQIIDVACGIGNVLANKGAVCILMRMKGKTVALINAHLAAHKTKVRQRNADYHRIMNAIATKAQPRWLRPSIAQKRKSLKGGAGRKPWLDKMFDAVGFPGDDKPATGYGSSSSPASASSSKGSPKRGQGGLRSMRMKKGGKESAPVHTAAAGPKRGAGTLADDCLFDATIFMGDLNYRLDLPRLEVELYKESLETKSTEEAAEELEGLLEHDQLIRERVLGHSFAGFNEGAISFMPTFKYDKGSDKFDTSSKERPPAWTDRILYRFVQPSTDEASSKKTEKKDRSATAEGGKQAQEKEEKTEGAKKPMLQLADYFSIDSRHSDHRPVSAKFILNL